MYYPNYNQLLDKPVFISEIPEFVTCPHNIKILYFIVM